MLRNYLKIAWRNLFINRLFSFLNIGGLAVGLACGILLLLWIAHELSYDTFHRNLPNIFLMMKNQTMSGRIFTGEATPAPLATKLRGQLPDIKHIARVGGQGKKLFNPGEESVYENGLYADPDLFNIMTFPALMGDPVEALRDPSSLVITERTAKKWFGNNNPLGKVVHLNNMQDLYVAAVIRDIPSNSSVNFDVALSFLRLEHENDLKWDNNSFITWLELFPGTDVPDFNKKVNAMVTAVEEGVELFAYPLARMHLHSSFENGKASGGKIYMVFMLSGIGIFILLIACINFMNLATARSERRAREVGVRKVIGSKRSMIIGQFLSESLLLTFIGLILAVVLAKLALPAFNHLVEKNLAFDFSNWKLWSMLLMLGLLTGLLAGSYPAFFLSHFQPVRVLKGVLSSGKGNARLRKALVTFQFFISIFLIISTIVIFKQLQYVQDRPLGYDQENLVEVPAIGDMKKKFEIVRQDLLQLPGITNVSAGSDNLLRTHGGLTGVQWPGKDPNEDFSFAVTWVQYDWTKTAGLTIVEGRDFNPEFSNDTQACLLNQTAIKSMNLKDPIGSLVNNHPVIGVIKDFVYNNPSSNPQPLIVVFSNDNLNHFFIRFHNDKNWQQTLAGIKQVFKKHNPSYPFELHFTKEEYEQSFREIISARQLITLFSVLAIFIACLGLLGLSSFVAERRKKEIGVRKILGATVSHISLSLSQDFLKPVLLSFLLSAPLAGWAMQVLLENMDYRIKLTWWMFALAGFLAVLIALLTVGFQSLKAAFANPAKSLRTE